MARTYYSIIGREMTSTSIATGYIKRPEPCVRVTPYPHANHWYGFSEIHLLIDVKSNIITSNEVHSFVVDMFDSAKICMIVVELFLLYVNTQIAGRELRVLWWWTF